MIAIIYVLSDPHTGEIRYVGYTTKTLEWRLRRHLSEARSGRTRRAKWLRSLGRSPEIHEVQVVPVDFRCEAERYWIAFYRELGCDLVNGTDGGDGLAFPTTETRAKMAAAQRGRKQTPEHVANSANARRGRPLSEATKAKLRARALDRWSGRPKKVKAERVLAGHGTRACYERGCRLDECRSANATYVRSRR